MTFLASSASISSNNSMLPLIIAGTCVATGIASIAKMKKEPESDVPHHSIKVTLPQWAVDELPQHYAKTYATDEEMMALAIHLSSRNATENTGGPFGCAIFERIGDGEAKLISVGINRVVALGNSTLHGETVAIQLAQSKLRSYTMSCLRSPHDNKLRHFELFTSCEPCAMCLGATLWSGVSRIVCGATKEDAEAIGFDEGPVFEESYEHLKKAGIDVKKMVLKDEAAKVLREYGSSGVIYN
jgi:tRNA(Arg) A34 adenosine deaminase TadA